MPDFHSEHESNTYPQRRFYGLSGIEPRWAAIETVCVRCLPRAAMKRTRKKAVPKPPADDLSFIPPYCEQAPYLLLADKFLSLDGSRQKVGSVDSNKRFRRTKKQKKAA
jgi:hypothetical protein